MEITITLPDTLVTTLRAGGSDTLDLAKLNADVLAKATLLGLGTKHRNFAASALMNCKVRAAGDKRNDETDEAYAKRLEKIVVSTEDLAAEGIACMVAGRKRLEAGDWGAERTGIPGEPAIDMAPIVYAMSVYDAKLRADIAGFADMKVADKRKAVNAWLDAKEGRRDVILKKVAEEKAAAMDI